jgi:outer membrane protein assembly factor BamB
MRTTLALLLFVAPVFADNWPQWRGPLANGSTAEKGIAAEWSDTRNIAWKAKLGGLGVSSPVVWGDRVFVTYQVGATALRAGNHPTASVGVEPESVGERPLGGARPTTLDDKVTFVVAAFSASNGHSLWEYKFDAVAPFPALHFKRNMATSSATTDGDMVYGWFSTGQIVALDMSGKLAWTRHLGADYGRLDAEWGHSSSPALQGERLILLGFGNTHGFLLALDKKTGKELWKVARQGDVKSYSTPLIIETAEGPQAIINHKTGVEAFDPATGKSLWMYSENIGYPVPMPLVADGVMYTNRGGRSGPFWAMKLGEQGEIPKDKLLWHVATGAPYSPSLVYHDGLLYFSTEVGVVTSVDAKTGQRVWQERLGGIYSASPIVADGKIYLFGETGETLVLKAGRTAEVIARNKLDMRVIASPAVSGGRIFVRGDDELVAISEAR